MYINSTNGAEVSVEEMQQYATEAEMSIEEYAAAAGFTLKSDDTTPDFPTSAVADADAVQQPMTASQAGYVEPKDTGSPSVDTSLDSQPDDPFVVNDKVVTQDEFERAASFDDDILAARTKLKEISLTAEEMEAIEVDSNRPPVKVYEGTGPGGTMKETYVYDEFIKEAKKEIATETKVDIYNIPEEEWRERAKKLYVKSREKSLFDDKKEAILEDYEETVYGTNPFSFARIKKLANRLPGTNLAPTKEDIKYIAGRGILTESFEADRKKASENYKKTITSISNYETLLNAGKVELDALQKKQADTPGSITTEDVARGKVLIQNQKLAYELYASEFDKLAEFEGSAETAAGLADITRRTYNNLDVVNNRMVSAGSRMIAGLGSVAKELSISQIVKRTTGVDIRDGEGRLPVYLRNIPAVDAYDRVFGSEKFEETVSNLYTLTDKIDQSTKAKQELGEIKGIEDFGEFMLDLFSEQAVNTVTTVGLGPAGLVAVSAAAGGNKFNEMDMEVANDPTRKISPAQFYASGILFGAAEYLTETVSLSQAKGALNYLGFGKKNFGKAFNISGKYSAEVISKSKALQNTFKSWGVNMAKEGGAEFSAQLLNNLTDINILNKEDINWSDGLSEAFVTGSLMSGLGFNAPALVGGIANTFRTESEADAYTKRGKEILRIRKEISTIQNNTGIADQASSQEAISTLQLELDGLVEQNILGIGIAAARVEELSQNDKRQLLDLDIFISKSKRGIDKINNNTKLTEDAKLRLILPLQNKIDSALKYKNKTLAASQNSKAKENQKKIQIQLAAEEGLNFEIVNAKNPEEAIKQANLIIDTAASDGKITPEQKSGLKVTLKELQEEVDSKTKATDINGQYFGAEFGLPITLSLEENLIENEMGATVLHETGHATVLKALMEGDGDALGIVADMEAYVGKRFKGAKAKFDAVNKIADRDGVSDIVRAEEKLAAMLEYVSQVELSKDMTFQGKLLNKWNKIAPKDKGQEITSIKTGADVFALINSFARSFDKGELSGLALKVAKGEVKAREKTEEQKAQEVSDEGSKKTFSKQLTPEQDTQLRSDVAEIKTLASEGETIAKKFNKEFVKGAKQTRLENKVLQEIKPVVDRVVTNRTKALYDPIADDAKKNVSRQMFQESMRSDIESMVFDEFTGKQDLEKFIVNRAFLRANNLAERLGIKNVKEGITKGLEAAEKVAVEETSAPKADKPKYRNILKSNTLPTETVNTIKDKVLRTIRTLKSKLDTEVSINKTVTPLVAEIKKNMGKQADIDFKKAMGGKKDGQLKRFLIKNKKAILENMTTTWLMGAMPGAVQKQVNGSFTSDWQGKKIDREKTSTQQAGRTSGAEIVRRLPNAFKNLDDKTYLSYVVDESGAPIRGRKESLAKAMAEELSFDIFTTELQNENSDIRKAFEGNQEALGVVLVDNYVQEVARDVERGTVKFSKILNAEQKKTVLDGSEKLKNKLLNANMTLTSKSLLPILIDTYPSIDEKTLKEFAKEGIQVVQRYTSDKTIDRTKNVDFGKFLFEGISLKESNSNLIKFFNFAKNEVKSLGGLFNNNNLVAKQRELEFTYNNNLVEKEGADGLIKILRWGRGHQATSGKIGGGRNQSYAGNGDYIANNLNNIPGVDVVWNPKTNRINDVKFNGKSIEEWKKRIKSPAQKASGGIELFKKEAKEREDAAREAWVYLTDYLQHVRDNGNAIDWTMTMMSLKSNMSSVLKAAAPVKYYFTGDVKGSLRYEHMIPTEYMVLKLTDYYFNGKKFDLNTLRDKYNVAIIPVSMDDNFNILTQSQMNSAFDPMTDPEFDRYYNENTFGFPNMYAIEALTGEYKGQIIGKSWVDFNNILKPQAAKMSKSVQTEQKAINNAKNSKWSKSTKKIRVFDFDDTLARTKSNVLYTMPGEVRVFHGGDIKSVKDIDGFVYFSEDQKQAAAYAKGNQGEVSSFKIDETSIATEDQVFDVINSLDIKPRAGYAVDESSLYELIDPRFEQSFSKKDLEKLAVALKRKGIKAARFTDTNISQGKNEGRETENIVVFDKKTVQEQSKLTAAEFAAKSDEMAAKGADFDFIEFSKVMNGQEGPLLKVAKIIAEKRGTDDLFVLTARPQDAAGPIQDFLAELGLDIPLENITGLADGNPKAKADWMVGKVSEGYNDFYFADDHLGNVKAVKDVFNTFDVKGKVQQAKIKFSKGLDKGFNDMIERQTGTESFKEFSKGVAQRRGKKVGKFKIFVSPSAEDFRGLTQYKFAGKGKQGEADQKFFEEALMDPYFKGVAALEAAREVIKNDTKALFKIFKPVKKKLNKLVPGIDFTYDGAVRVFLWNKAGIEIPGLTKRDNKKLNDVVANDPELSAFADALLLVSKQDTWPAPGEYWEAKTTLSDLNNLTEKTNRKEYLAEFIENVDIIFSEKNLNKVEALYGKASRTAIENAIYAMKTGSNSPNQNGDVITNRWLKWVNNSIGTIMFFNRRSALLQLTSATNFLNWSDNNPAKAALAFANQPQYWKDWAMIFNSDKLKQRRSGLKSDVQESEIANAAKNTEDKIGSIIAYLLKIGFSPTQIADSIAISSGGATFYRNRVNTYKKQGLDIKEAETKAFQDFSKLSDEAQQSGDPALVSQQQRSVAGRLILSFQNTTMQYTRLMKKAGQDLVNRRGDPKTHISKILYYGALQNFIFNALSQTAFALIPGFDEEEDEDKAKRDEKLEKKAAVVLNGMADSVIRGTGIYGAVVTTIKNTYNTWKREADKGFKGDQAKTILEAANISPAIGSKLRKIYSAIQAYQFDKAVMEKHPWSVTIDGKFNPSATYSVIGSLASATLNLPLDRALAEARGIAEMFDNRNSEMQRLALALGWRTWNVGAKNEEFDLIKMEAKQAKKDKKAKEKADFDVYRRKVFKVLTMDENIDYSGTKGAAAKKEYILRIGKEKGIN